MDLDYFFELAGTNSAFNAAYVEFTENFTHFRMLINNFFYRSFSNAVWKVHSSAPFKMIKNHFYLKYQTKNTFSAGSGLKCSLLMLFCQYG